MIIKMVKNLLRLSLGMFYRFNPFFRYSVAKSLTVFVFHEVTDKPSNFAEQYGLTLKVDQFKDQIHWINSNFNVVSPELVAEDLPLPNNAALITFDDGFSGAFLNAFPILKKLDIPVLMFMNMQPQIERRPMLAAKALYLIDHSPCFKTYLKGLGITDAPHLRVTPDIMEKFVDQYGVPDQDQINSYQGDLVDRKTMDLWDSSPNVHYGNHFYDHWNAAALSSHELEDQFLLNKKALGKYRSSIDFFAFTNGKPHTCFSIEDVHQLEALGARKIFSTVNGVNKDVGNTLLGRVNTHATDESSYHLWCRVGLSYSNFS